VKVAARIVIVGVLLVCAAGVVWMFAGSAAGDRVVGNANVVGGVAGVLALVVAVGVLWPRVERRRAGAVEILGGPGALLHTSLDRQVLRQAGAVYQFRHAALQDLLAAQASTEPATSGQHTSRRPESAK
jgi:hypothetical protein